jgi:hypothetical protein
MGLFKRAHVRGMSHRLSALGLVSWPSKEAEELASDIVADDFTDREMREVTAEDGLTPKEAALAVRRLAQVANDLTVKSGGYRDVGVNKFAAEANPIEAAYYAADCVMVKAAEDVASGNAPGGTEDMAVGGFGPVDAEKNPSSEWTGPKGVSRLDTSPGAVGDEKPQEKKPGNTDITPSEVAKLSAFLSKLSEETAAVGTPHEPKDNLKTPGTFAKGKTVQPTGPQIGEQKPQPAKQQTSASTPNEPSKLARARNLLSKLSEELEAEEKEEKEEKEEEHEEHEGKKKEKKEHKEVPAFLEPKTNEGEIPKSAAINEALRNLARAIQ